jgi:hypothetical protein
MVRASSNDNYQRFETNLYCRKNDSLDARGQDAWPRPHQELQPTKELEPISSATGVSMLMGAVLVLDGSQEGWGRKMDCPGRLSQKSRYFHSKHGFH